MKRKSIVLSALLCFVIIHGSQAQKVSIGFRGGLTIPNLSGDENNPLQKGYSSRKGTGFGIFAEFKISRLFSIQPMLEYSQQGAKSSGTQAIAYDPSQVSDDFNTLIDYLSEGKTPPYLYANFKAQAKLNYLMLPVLSKFGWNLGKQNHWRIYLDAGPFVGYLLNAHQIISGGATSLYLDADEKNMVINPLDNSVPQFDFDTTSSIKSSIHRFNFGVEANAGIAYQFKRNSVFIEFGGNYGLLNIQKHAEDGKNHSGAATIMIGYAIKL